MIQLKIFIYVTFLTREPSRVIIGDESCFTANNICFTFNLKSTISYCWK